MEEKIIKKVKRIKVSTDEARPFFNNYPRRRGQLHASPSEGFLGIFEVVLVGFEGHYLLTWEDPGGSTNGLSEGPAHALRNTVSSGARGLLVLPYDLVREDTDLKIVVHGPRGPLKIPVSRDTSGLKGRVPYLALFLDNKYHGDRELSGQVTLVELGYPALGDTAHVLPSLVRLSSDVSVHLARFPSHSIPLLSVIVILVLAACDVSRDLVPEIGRRDIGKLCYHYFIVFVVPVELVREPLNQVLSDPFYIGGLNISHVFITVSGNRRFPVYIRMGILILLYYI
jgi:hypothetical protein